MHAWGQVSKTDFLIWNLAFWVATMHSVELGLGASIGASVLFTVLRTISTQLKHKGELPKLPFCPELSSRDGRRTRGIFYKVCERHVMTMLSRKHHRDAYHAERLLLATSEPRLLHVEYAGISERDRTRNLI